MTDNDALRTIDVSDGSSGSAEQFRSCFIQSDGRPPGGTRLSSSNFTPDEERVVGGRDSGFGSAGAEFSEPPALRAAFSDKSGSFDATLFGTVPVTFEGAIAVSGLLGGFGGFPGGFCAGGFATTRDCGAGSSAASDEGLATAAVPACMAAAAAAAANSAVSL